MIATSPRRRVSSGTRGLACIARLPSGITRSSDGSSSAGSGSRTSRRRSGRTGEAWSAIDLRPYQEAALAAWELGYRRGVVALPTGSGKTRLALAAVQRTGLSALCLVPTRVLLDQWLREIDRLRRGPVGCYGDGVRQLHPLTVATLESAYRHMTHIGDRFDLLIVDEVHHFGGGLRDEALEMAVAGARLGLTATPARGTTAARLAELVGPTLFELAVADLAGGFLASFDAVTLHLDLSSEERSAYTGLSSVFQGFYAEFVARPRRPLGWISLCMPPAPRGAAARWRRGARCDDCWPSRWPSAARLRHCSSVTGPLAC
jgi:superfamily II DNA or RNA helicase